MTQTTFTELARRIYDLPNGLLLHFKTSGGNDTEFYGVTRLDLFECDTILLSLYGGHNTSAFDASADYDAASIESWLKDVVGAGACDGVYLMDNAEVFPDRHELWGVTFAAISSDGQPYRTQAVSEVSLFDSEAQAQDWIDCQEGGPYDSGFPAEDCSDPRPVLIDQWDVKQSKCEPVKHDSQPPSYWDRILGLRDELTGRITALLQKHHLQTIDIPDDYEDTVGMTWVDDDGYAYDGEVKTVSIYEKGISLNVGDNDGNHASLYSYNDIGCEHVEWLVRILDMLTDLLEGDKWRICSHCGKLMSEGYINKMGEPTEYYCSDECLHQHYTPQEWAQLCQGPEGQEDAGNDFCCWTTWH